MIQAKGLVDRSGVQWLSKVLIINRKSCKAVDHRASLKWKNISVQFPRIEIRLKETHHHLIIQETQETYTKLDQASKICNLKLIVEIKDS